MPRRSMRSCEPPRPAASIRAIRSGVAMRLRCMAREVGWIGTAANDGSAAIGCGAVYTTLTIRKDGAIKPLLRAGGRAVHPRTLPSIGHDISGARRRLPDTRTRSAAAAPSRRRDGLPKSRPSASRQTAIPTDAGCGIALAKPCQPAGQARSGARSARQRLQYGRGSQCGGA